MFDTFVLVLKKCSEQRKKLDDFGTVDADDDARRYRMNRDTVTRPINRSTASGSVFLEISVVTIVSHRQPSTRKSCLVPAIFC